MIADDCKETIIEILSSAAFRDTVFLFPLSLSCVKRKDTLFNPADFATELVNNYDLVRSIKSEDTDDIGYSYGIIRKAFPKNYKQERLEYHEIVEAADRGNEYAKERLSKIITERSCCNFVLRKIYSIADGNFRKEFIRTERSRFESMFKEMNSETKILALLAYNNQFWNKNQMKIDLHCEPSTYKLMKETLEPVLRMKIHKLTRRQGTWLDKACKKVFRRAPTLYISADFTYCDEAVSMGVAVSIGRGRFAFHYSCLKNWIIKKCIESVKQKYRAYDSEASRYEFLRLQVNRLKENKQRIVEAWRFSRHVLNPSLKRTAGSSRTVMGKKIMKNGKELQYNLVDIEDLTGKDSPTPACIGFLHFYAEVKDHYPRNKQRNHLTISYLSIGYDEEETQRGLASVVSKSTRMSQKKQVEFSRALASNVKSVYNGLQQQKFGERSCTKLAAIARELSYSDIDKIGCPFIYASDDLLSEYFRWKGMEDKDIKSIIRKRYVNRTGPALPTGEILAPTGQTACHASMIALYGAEKCSKGLMRINFPSHYFATVMTEEVEKDE